MTNFVYNEYNSQTVAIHQFLKMRTACLNTSSLHISGRGSRTSKGGFYSMKIHVQEVQKCTNPTLNYIRMITNQIQNNSVRKSTFILPSPFSLLMSLINCFWGDREYTRRVEDAAGGC